MSKLPVIFMQLTQSQYNGISPKDSGTLYFCTDTQKIYLGSALYGGKDIAKLTIKNGTNTIEYDGSSDKSIEIPTVTVDTKLSTTSTNPVQNKAVKSEIDKKLSTSGGTVNGALTVNGNLTLGGSLVSDNVIDSGTSGDWEYIKYSSGLAMMWCNVTAEYSNASVLEKWVSYPFALQAGVSAFGTLEGVGDNAGSALGWNVKIVPQGDNQHARVFVHNPSGSFGGADALTVAVLVLGRYKQQVNQAQIVGTATVGTVITADRLNQIEESNASTDSKITTVTEVMK